VTKKNKWMKDKDTVAMMVMVYDFGDGRCGHDER
jgi:hypothetical protein